MSDEIIGFSRLAKCSASRARMSKLIVFAVSVTSVSPKTKWHAKGLPIESSIGVQNAPSLLVPPAESNDTSRTEW